MTRLKFLFFSILTLTALCWSAIEASSLDDLSNQQRQDNIFFQNGGSVIDATAREQIIFLAKILDHPKMSKACIRLIGFSDATGRVDTNETISTQRAENVAELLRSLITDPKRIEVIRGRGAVEFMEAVPPKSHLQRRVRVEARDCN